MAKKKEDTQAENDNKHDRMIQMQVMQEQIMQLKSYIDQYETQLADINKLLETIDEISTLKGDEDVLIPVSNGIFIEGKIKNVDQLKVNVGSGCIVGKTFEETRELLREQYNELDMIRGQAMIQFHEFVNQMQRLEQG